MTATAATPRGSVTRRFAALLGYVFRACLPRRRLAVLALPSLVIVLGGLLTHAVGNDSSEPFVEVATLLIFGLAAPLGALVIGDAVLGAEVRSGTLAFTWLTPARFGEIVVARWLGGFLVALGTIVPAAGVAAVLGASTEHAVPVMAGTATSAGGHLALFVLIGCLTRRAAVWSLGVLLLGERLLGAVLSSIAQFSPTWLGWEVFVAAAGVQDEFVRLGVPDGWGAFVRMAIVTAVFLVGASFGLGRLQLAGGRD